MDLLDVYEDSQSLRSIVGSWTSLVSSRRFTSYPNVSTVLTKDTPAKGLNFAVISEQVLVRYFITATESIIRNYQPNNSEMEQLSLKVSAALASANVPPSNRPSQKRC